MVNWYCCWLLWRCVGSCVCDGRNGGNLCRSKYATDHASHFYLRFGFHVLTSGNLRRRNPLYGDLKFKLKQIIQHKPTQSNDVYHSMSVARHCERFTLILTLSTFPPTNRKKIVYYTKIHYEKISKLKKFCFLSCSLTFWWSSRCKNFVNLFIKIKDINFKSFELGIWTWASLSFTMNRQSPCLGPK